MYYKNHKTFIPRSTLIIDSLSILTLLTTFIISSIYNFSYWYLILVLPIGMFIICWMFSYILVFSLSFFCSKTKKYAKPNPFFNHLFNASYDILIGSSRTSIILDGFDKLNDLKENTFILVSNHLSRFDNMIESLVLDKYKLAFISKPSNFKIPFGNRYMNRCLYLCMNRDSLKDCLNTIKEASRYLKDDITSIGIFPEGTRSSDYEIHEFKPGAFKLAFNSMKPIIICSIDNTYNIHKNFPFRRTKVYLKLIDILTYEDYKDLNSVNLSLKVNDMIKVDLYNRRNK